MTSLSKTLKDNHKDFLSVKPILYFSQEEVSRRQLHKIGQAWDATIRNMLKDLGALKWSGLSCLGTHPKKYRVRRMDSQAKITWWVEHDIPPYDHFRCAAYIVELELAELPEFNLLIESGTHKYLVEQPVSQSLQALMSKVASEPPAIIPRRMGRVED